MFGWKMERKDGLTVKLLSNGDLIIRLHYLRELLYGQKINLDPVSEKGWGFVSLRLMSIGRGLRGRENGDEQGRGMR